MINLRPASFDEFIGQEEIKKNLRVFIKSSKIRKSVLDHVLIYGSTGLGKTSMAYIIANELNKRIIYLNGNSLQKSSDIISPLTKVKDNSILFIDEIHAVSKEVFETLYPVLEDFKLNIIVGKEYNSKTINVKIPEFTLIGATTEVEKISEPLYNRFPIIFHFSDYKNEDIQKIIELTLSKLSIKYNNNDVILELSNYCRDNPRVANNICKRIFDYYVMEKLKIIDISIVNRILSELGIYKYGLNEIDLIILKTLSEYRNGLGIESLSQIVNINSKTIISNAEPILVKKQLIQKTSRGRVITQKGIQYLAKYS